MIARAAAAAAVVLAVVMLYIVLVGGGEKHTYSLLFQSAGQLVKGDDVQIGGRPVGTINSIELTGDNLAKVNVTVEEPYAPLHEGTTALIRATSLSGVANRYIALTPGADNAKEIDDKGTLRVDKTTTIVDLDQLINTLDDNTRQDLQKVIKGFSTQLDGAGGDANEAARYFNPVLSTSRRLVQQLTADDGVLTQFVVNGAKTVDAIAQRRQDLASAVSATNATAGAIAAEDASFDQALSLLPTTLRRGNTTFVNLRSTLDDLDPLVAESKVATRRLAPFLRALRPLVSDARPTIADLRRLVRRPGANNDLVEATLKFPRLERTARSALRNGRKALEGSQEVVSFYRPYAPDLVGWLRDFGQGASNYDANGHYARIAPVANAFSFVDNPAGGLLNAIPANARLDQLDSGNMERCPGAATQEAPDGSNNWVGSLPDGGCKPDQTPAGP